MKYYLNFNYVRSNKISTELKFWYPKVTCINAISCREEFFESWSNHSKNTRSKISKYLHISIQFEKNLITTNSPYFLPFRYIENFNLKNCTNIQGISIEDSIDSDSYKTRERKSTECATLKRLF